MTVSTCEECREALAICTCHDVCEYCDGDGVVEIDPIGPEQDSTTDTCVCQLTDLL
jgi:hypothetical protein